MITIAQLLEHLDGNGLVLTDPDEVDRALVECDVVPYCVVVNLGRHEDSLIAAAPELLEACRAALSGPHTMDVDTQVLIEAAIRKAEGRS